MESIYKESLNSRYQWIGVPRYSTVKIQICRLFLQWLRGEFFLFHTVRAIEALFRSNSYRRWPIKVTCNICLSLSLSLSLRLSASWSSCLLDTVTCQLHFGTYNSQTQVNSCSTLNTVGAPCSHNFHLARKPAEYGNYCCFLYDVMLLFM